MKAVGHSRTSSTTDDRVTATVEPCQRRLTPPELLFLRERARDEPLAPTGSLQPVNSDAVENILGPDGALSRVVAGFERRPQQERMALAVAEAINEQGQLLVEAGTGTGKSLAYLVPAALASTERGEPVVLVDEYAGAPGSAVTQRRPGSGRSHDLV